MPIQNGIDRIAEHVKNLRGLRLGMVTNDAATTAKLQPSRAALLAAGLNLQVLFSPEHGLQATGTDGAPMPDATDPLTQLPVRSLYTAGQKIAPTLLAELDAVLFDLPDVGSRFYTYIWTLSQLMEACERAGKRLIVLDRPNPISGDLQFCEGPMLDEAHFSSFIGRWKMPVRHGLTVGELARHWQKSRSMWLDLQVIEAKGWRRGQFFQDFGLPFVPTSPAISCADTLLSYPALCFLEGTNWSEGRGTVSPFQICGSPRADGWRLAEAFNSLKISGVAARSIAFRPWEGKFAGENCSGIMLHVTDRRQFRPLRAGLSLVALLKKLWPENFHWANYPTAANPSGARHFDLLAGTDAVREAIERDTDYFLKNVDAFLGVGNWAEEVHGALIYGN